MPPATPIRSATTARQIVISVVASTRGTTRNRTGWIAAARSALTSSPTTIVPSSAAMLAPANPVKTIAPTSGPSSLKILTAIRSAVFPRRPIGSARSAISATPK